MQELDQLPGGGPDLPGLGRLLGRVEVEADVMNANGSQLRTVGSPDSQSEWDLGVNTQAWICAADSGSRRR